MDAFLGKAMGTFFINFSIWIKDLVQFLKGYIWNWKGVRTLFITLPPPRNKKYCSVQKFPWACLDRRCLRHLEKNGEKVQLWNANARHTWKRLNGFLKISWAFLLIRWPRSIQWKFNFERFLYKSASDPLQFYSKSCCHFQNLPITNASGKKKKIVNWKSKLKNE